MTEILREQLGVQKSNLGFQSLYFCVKILAGVCQVCRKILIFVFISIGTSCGSINSITGDNGHPRLDNGVHLQFSSSSRLHGMIGVRLPFHCLFNSNPFGPIFGDDDEDGIDQGGGSSGGPTAPSLYKMKVIYLSKSI